LKERVTIVVAFVSIARSILVTRAVEAGSVVRSWKGVFAHADQANHFERNGPQWDEIRQRHTTTKKADCGRLSHEPRGELSPHRLERHVACVATVPSESPEVFQCIAQDEDWLSRFVVFCEELYAKSAEVVGPRIQLDRLPRASLKREQDLAKARQARDQRGVIEAWRPSRENATKHIEGVGLRCETEE
jgi:hypothetical protein